MQRTGSHGIPIVFTAHFRTERLLATAAIALSACSSGANTGAPSQREAVAQTALADQPSCTPLAKFEVVPTDGDSFLHRTGHAVVALNDALYIARGLADDIDTQTNTFRDDLFQFVTDENDGANFAQLAETGAVPGPLGFPCMISNDDDGSLLLFGGASYVFELNPNFFQSFTPNNTLWHYQLDSGAWTQLAPAGTLPSRRNGCNAVRFRNSMYMFGGLSRFLQPNSELWQYDIAANAWQEAAPAGALPPPRFIASAAIDTDQGDGRIYVYNGLQITAQGFSQIGDFWVYDIATNEWRQIADTPTPPRNKGVFSELPGPCGKRYLVYSTGNIDTSVHCTGFDEDTTAINEVWAFDLEAETWQKLETVGDAPRLNFAQGATLGNKQYLIGGWYDVPDPVRVCRQVWNETVYSVSLVQQ